MGKYDSIGATTLEKINEFLYVWNLKRRQCQEIFNIEGRINEEDLRYYLPSGINVVDYGLCFDHEPFKWKLPIIFKYLWTAPQNECIKLSNQMISFEKKKLKDGGISDEELGYVLVIKNIIGYVMKHRFKANEVNIRKVIGGDYKDKSHFTVG